MTALYKLIFDLTVYYSLAGYYFNVIAGQAPSALGYLLLCITAGLYLLLRSRGASPERCRPVLILPVLTFVLWPGIWSAIHMLPAWFYLGWALVTARTEITYLEYHSHFNFGLGIQGLMAPCFMFFPQRGGPAFIDAIPYITVLLAVGICLMRLLRENTKSGAKQAAFILAFVAGCALLTVGQAPQLLMAGVKWLYQHVVAVGILVLVLTVGMMFYYLGVAFYWLVSLLKGEEAAEPQMDMRSVAETMGLEEELLGATATPLWLNILLYCLAGLLVLGVIFLIFRKLLGSRSGQTARTPWEEERESIDAPARRRRRSLTRPRDPRLAVRFYYARFLDECRRRGLSLRPGLTGEELAHYSEKLFPGAEGMPAKLTRVYSPARYSLRTPVTPGQVTEAEQLWRDLRKTKRSE